MKTNLYAIRFKHFVEIRQASKPPQKVRTTHKMMMIVPKEGELVNRGYYMERKIVDTRVKVTLVSVVYRGGRVVACMKKNTFSSIYGRSLSQGEIVQLDPALWEKIAWHKSF